MKMLRIPNLPASEKGLFNPASGKVVKFQVLICMFMAITGNQRPMGMAMTMTLIVVAMTMIGNQSLKPIESE